LAKVAVVFNPVSGHVPAERREQVIRDGFADHDVDLVWLETSREDAGREAATKAVADGADMVAVAGGDGTVRAASAGLMGSGVPMAVLPSGTGNLFAINLGIPVHHLDAAVEVAMTGQWHRVDVGVGDVAVNGLDNFLVMAGLGYDAAMLLGTDPGLKRKHGNLAYVRSGLAELRYPQDQYVLTLDGKAEAPRRASCVLLANVGHIGKDITLVHGTRPDDGQLDVTVIRAHSIGDWLQVVARVTFRRKWGDVRVETFRASHIDISSQAPHHLEYDGEVGEPVTHLGVEVAPGAIIVCAP
jgi:diacylglycerol kinase (ATP)